MEDVSRENARELEEAVLKIIQYARDRCGAGFGNLPLGARAALDFLLPLVSESDRVKESLADLDARLGP